MTQDPTDELKKFVSRQVIAEINKIDPEINLEDFINDLISLRLNQEGSPFSKSNQAPTPDKAFNISHTTHWTKFHHKAASMNKQAQKEQHISQY